MFLIVLLFLCSPAGLIVLPFGCQSFWKPESYLIPSSSFPTSSNSPSVTDSSFTVSFKYSHPLSVIFTTALTWVPLPLSGDALSLSPQSCRTSCQNCVIFQCWLHPPILYTSSRVLLGSPRSFGILPLAVYFHRQD